jgi:hypothetical protein
MTGRVIARYEPRDITVRGAPEHLVNVTRGLADRGRLVTRPMDIVPVRHPDGTASVRLRVMTAVTVPRRSVRTTVRAWSDRNPVATAVGKALSWGLAVSLSVLGLIVGVGYAVKWALLGLLHGLNLAKLGGGGLGLLAVIGLLYLFGSRVNHSGACTGLHCPGCKG